MVRLARGFTLLEVMVVLMIVGMLLSLVNLNFSDRAARQEAEQLAKRLTVAFNQYREEALFQNLDLGLAWHPERFALKVFYDIRLPSVVQGMSQEQVSQLQDNPWAKGDLALAESQSIPETLSLKIEVEGDEVEPADDLDDEAPIPVIFFFSSDEYTPLAVTVRHPDDDTFALRVFGDGVGPIRWEVMDEF